MKRNLSIILLVAGTQLPALAQTASNPLSTTGGASGGSGGGVSFVGSSSPLRPLRSYYPRAQIQNASNPWLPPNLGQVNTNLSPVGSISPTGTLTQPTSVLNTGGTVQQAGFPSVPSYNIGTPAPTTQSINLGSTAGQASIANPSNPSGQGTSSITGNGSASRSNPTNPLYP